MKKIEYKTCTVSNYLTDDLEKILNKYGEYGYKLINTIFGKNQYGIEVLFLFFAREVEE